MMMSLYHAMNLPSTTVSDPVINYTDKLATPVQQPAKECTDQSASDKQQRIIKSVTSACLLNSPARKKNKGTASFTIHSPSPVKTPKRKQSKASLQWDSEDTTSFVDILVAHKDDLVLPQIPLSTWKEISLALRDITVIKSWQNCRD
uniref:Uncharacterized protein n=1 Tax=Solanum lycopersicum TaxID=4081 RepID=A0A494G9Q2_SOLLC